MREDHTSARRPTTRADRSARRARVARWVAVPVGMLVSSLLVWQASNAAFSDTTDNPGNQWASGDVVLSDDDSTNVLFHVSNLKPGDNETRCITVTYSGSLNASVKLYAATAGTGLAQYLDLTVEQGTGGAFGDCTGFTPGASPTYTGTLAGFASAYQNFGNGWGSFAPTGGAPIDSKTYRIKYTLQNDNAAQGKDASATFTWEAQNTP
jgi:hypothetical protein